MSEAFIPGTPHFFASQLVESAQAKFANRELPSTDPEFIAFVYSERVRLLEKENGNEVPDGIEEFVQERLARCGFHAFKADVGSIAELWDIFDDYDFQVMMGRIP